MRRLLMCLSGVIKADGVVIAAHDAAARVDQGAF